MHGESTTAREVLHALEGMAWFPHSAKGCRLAVNHAFAGDDTPIRESDEVALIGLVSGG